MGKYSAYPEYKDSGIEWLDKVPTHWIRVPIKYMATKRGTLFIDGDWIESKDLSTDGIRYITTGNVGEGVYKEQGAGYITEDKFVELNCTEVFEGDLLISRLNSPIGRACIVPNLNERIVTSVDNVILRPNREYYRNYLRHAFSSEAYFAHTGILSRGATMQRISRGLLGNICVPLPLSHEQQTIANFLDHETAKIDLLIAKQERLIELLKEKRQAVISHAVTKGINPDAPKKDSGVEWLGEVPEHWEVSQIGFVSKLIQTGPFGSQLHAEDYIDGGIPVINPAHIQAGRIVSDEKISVSEETAHRLARHSLSVGEIIFARRGELGRCALVTDAAAGWICGTGSLKIRLDTTQVDPEVVALFLGTPGVREELSLCSKGSTMENLNTEILSKIPLAFPGLAEQAEIVAHVRSTDEKLERLFQRVNDAITLLREHRTALISAAVTGKIDVRGWQKPATKPEEAAAAVSA